MRIEVRQAGFPAVMNTDGEFRCPHLDTEVIPPCCTGRDCACNGQYSVVCHDCQGEDLTQDTINELIERRTSGEEVY